MKPPTTMLVDTASLYFRAFFGMPSSLVSPSGQPVNAVRGLLDSLARLITEHSPVRFACCWDDDWRPDWRVALVPSYKAHRVAAAGGEEVPEQLAPQVPIIREVLHALGFAVVGTPGMEADDVIATLATLAPGPVDVVTGDRDLFQLVADGRGVRVLYVARGVANLETVDDAWLTRKYGITGAQYVDFAVMRGDPSDGLPGVKGVGDKTAAKLLAQYGSLPGILARSDELSPGVRRAFEAASDYLPGATRVVTAVADLPLAGTPLPLPTGPRYPARFAELAAQYGLGSSAERIGAALAHRSGEST